ncbi:MAG: MFS transporter [Pseudomonadota bacterium]
MVTTDQAPQPSAALSFCAEKNRKLILTAAILASSLGFIDGTVVSIALPAMRASLEATLPQAQWFSNAYMLFLSALILAGGALGDRFGLARVFSIGIGAFILASLACAVAPTPEFMIVARALKGVGAALMVPGSLALISRAYPKAERGRAIGIWAAASALTTALGPIIGGLVLTAGGPEFWRWIFAINLPLGLLALWILRRAVKSDPAQEDHPVDWIGAGLATAGLGALAYGLTALEGAGPALPALGLSVLLMAAFLWHEARDPHPMMPLSLFADARFSAANLATFLLYAALGAMLFYLPMAVITAWEVTPIEASAAFAPLSIFISTLSTRMGSLADRYGPEPIIAIGAGIVALAYLATAVTAPLQSFWFATFPAMVLAGLGMAFVVAPLSAAVMGSVDDSETGAASGVNNAISRMASLVAIAAFGSLAAWSYGAAGGTLSFGGDETGPGHVAAVNAAFAAISYVAAALCAASSVVMLAARSRRAV